MSEYQELRFNKLLSCCEKGDHQWRYWSANDQVDPITFSKTDVCHMLYYPDGEPSYRGCQICGKVEIKGIWEEVKHI